MLFECLLTCFADKLSAETVCSKDSMSGLAPSVVASGKLGVELAFRLDETRGVDRTPPDDLEIHGWGDIFFKTKFCN